MAQRDRRVLDQQLTALGYTLDRCAKHLIYKHQSGACITVSLTTSCHHGYKNALADAKRELRKRGLYVV